MLTVVWPFHLALAEGVEVYLPVAWTAAASTYVLGAASLPVMWLGATSGFVLIVVLDRAGLVRATGLAAENVRRWRGEPFDASSGVDGNLRHFTNLGENAVRVAAIAGVRALAPGASPFLWVAVAEAAAAAWLRVVPIPGRMAPARMRARIARALGRDVLIATQLPAEPGARFEVRVPREPAAITARRRAAR